MVNSPYPLSNGSRAIEDPIGDYASNKANSNLDNRSNSGRIYP